MHDTTDARPGCLHCGASLADATPETVLCESCKDADHARAMNECQQARPDWRDPAALPYLVARFSAALLDKLRAAEAKYGYRNDWLRADWMDDCRAELWRHVEKGDPRDVAAYCAFLWHHGERTVAPSVVADAGAGDAVPTLAECIAGVGAMLGADPNAVHVNTGAARKRAEGDGPQTLPDALTLLAEYEARCTTLLKRAVRAEADANAERAEVAQARSALDAATRRAEAAEADAKRWRFVEPMLEAESDFTDDSAYAKSYSFVYAPNDFEKLCAGGVCRTVNEIVDAAIDAALAPSRAVPMEDRT